MRPSNSRWERQRRLNLSCCFLRAGCWSVPAAWTSARFLPNGGIRGRVGCCPQAGGRSREDPGSPTWDTPVGKWKIPAAPGLAARLSGGSGSETRPRGGPSPERFSPGPAGAALLAASSALWPEEETRRRANGTTEAEASSRRHRHPLPRRSRGCLPTSTRRRTAAVTKWRQRACWRSGGGGGAGVGGLVGGGAGESQGGRRSGGGRAAAVASPPPHRPTAERVRDDRAAAAAPEASPSVGSGPMAGRRRWLPPGAGRST